MIHLQADEAWATVWAASSQGPYPAGNPSAQPEQGFIFPDPLTGARDQTFRLMLRPDIWGSRVRLRFTNLFGSRPLHITQAYVGLQALAGRLVRDSNHMLLFGGHPGATIPPGGLMWSDPLHLPFAEPPTAPLLQGKRLAVSFHVAGESGPMTWHAKALTTSYVSSPGSAPCAAEEDEAPFPHTTASWFFIDAVDMVVAKGTRVVVCLGDSITDGTLSTMNGDDRWPDFLARRLHAEYPGQFAVVNAGIGGNQVRGPAVYSPGEPVNGGPSALERLDRDVLSLSSVRAVVWMEGVNDFGIGEATAESVIQGMRDGVARMRAAIPGIRVIGATLSSARNAAQESHARPEVEEKRQAVNRFIREGGLFDSVADFDAATLNPKTGEIRPEMQPNSTIGGEGDKLHPNRLGLMAMGYAIDLETLAR